MVKLELKAVLAEILQPPGLIEIIGGYDEQPGLPRDVIFIDEDLPSQMKNMKAIRARDYDQVDVLFDLVLMKYGAINSVPKPFQDMVELHPFGRNGSLAIFLANLAKEMTNFIFNKENVIDRSFEIASDFEDGHRLTIIFLAANLPQEENVFPYTINEIIADVAKLDRLGEQFVKAFYQRRIDDQFLTNLEKQGWQINQTKFVYNPSLYEKWTPLELVLDQSVRSGQLADFNNFQERLLKERSDKEQSDKERSDKEQSDKEQSDKERSDKEQSDKEQSDKECLRGSASNRLLPGLIYDVKQYINQSIGIHPDEKNYQAEVNFSLVELMLRHGANPNLVPNLLNRLIVTNIFDEKGDKRPLCHYEDDRLKLNPLLINLLQTLIMYGWKPYITKGDSLESDLADLPSGVRHRLSILLEQEDS